MNIEWKNICICVAQALAAPNPHHITLLPKPDPQKYITSFCVFVKVHRTNKCRVY